MEHKIQHRIISPLDEAEVVNPDKLKLIGVKLKEGVQVALGHSQDNDSLEIELVFLAPETDFEIQCELDTCVNLHDLPAHYALPIWLLSNEDEVRRSINWVLNEETVSVVIELVDHSTVFGKQELDISVNILNEWTSCKIPAPYMDQDTSKIFEFSDEE